jgi:hypothetical protein
MLFADFRYDVTNTIVGLLDIIDLTVMEQKFADMEAEGARQLETARTTHQVDQLYPLRRNALPAAGVHHQGPAAGRRQRGRSGRAGATVRGRLPTPIRSQRAEHGDRDRDAADRGRRPDCETEPGGGGSRRRSIGRAGRAETSGSTRQGRCPPRSGSEATCRSAARSKGPASSRKTRRQPCWDRPTPHSSTGLETSSSHWEPRHDRHEGRQQTKGRSGNPRDHPQPAHRHPGRRGNQPFPDGVQSDHL